MKTTDRLTDKKKWFSDMTQFPSDPKTETELQNHECMRQNVKVANT